MRAVPGLQNIFMDGRRNNIFLDGRRNNIFMDGHRNNIFMDGRRNRAAWSELYRVNTIHIYVQGKLLPK